MKGKRVFTNKFKAIVTAIAFVVFLGLESHMNFLPANADEDVVVSVVAHRGYSGMYPENTIAAFNAAEGTDAGFVELDVRKSLDGELVIFHDESFEKYNGDTEHGVSDFTYEELQQIDVGSYISADYSGVRIPTLEQSLLTMRCKNYQIIVELKDIGEDPEFASQVYEVCRKTGVLNRVIFGSFNYSYLQDIKSIDHTRPIMVFASFGKSNLPKKYPAEYYGVNMRTLSATTIRAIHEAGSEVFAYTVETRGQLLNLQRMGADGIITNYPDLNMM